MLIAWCSKSNVMTNSRRQDLTLVLGAQVMLISNTSVVKVMWDVPPLFAPPPADKV